MTWRIFSGARRSNSVRSGAITSPSFGSSRLSSEPSWPVLPVSKIVGFMWASIAAEIAAARQRGSDFGRLFAKAQDSPRPNRHREQGRSKECRTRRTGGRKHGMFKEHELFPHTAKGRGQT